MSMTIANVAGAANGAHQRDDNTAQRAAPPRRQGARKPARYHTWYRKLLARAALLPPLRTAVVLPLDAHALLGAVEAAAAGLIIPVLVGPRAAMLELARAEHADLAACEIVETASEAPAAAAARAVALARSGAVGALMKGSLRTDELMHAAVARETGLVASDGRRMSHIFVLYVPRYPRPLLLTDGALTIAPTLEVKRYIVQNAIDLALALGIARPRVAILSATEIVIPRLRSSLDAAALTVMAQRGQITGGVVDGPLAFDDAVSRGAARAKGIRSPVAGRADIVVVPDLDAGNMLGKQLEYLSGARMAGIVVGG
ncbi:MAG TPA: bifunctional enoyl-CoA hydratase/phosphate acetyltransferase, partial [Steroidobacteraceae bacterium]|nr:bifunctional enoyl-CoA hydratase/phosphate acetyltransferase [Steroidobacteraceae bacterium]